MYRTVPCSKGTPSTIIFLRSVTCPCSVRRKCAKTFLCYAGIFHTHSHAEHEHTVQEHFSTQQKASNSTYRSVFLPKKIIISTLCSAEVLRMRMFPYYITYRTVPCSEGMLSPSIFLHSVTCPCLVRRKCAKIFPCYAGIFHTNTLPRWTGTHCTGTVPLSVGTSHHVQGYFPAQWEYSPKGKNELISLRGKWKQGKGNFAKKAVLTMLRDFLVRVSMGSDMRGTVTHSGVLMSPPSRSTSITSNCKPVTTLKMHSPQLLYKINQL